MQEIRSVDMKYMSYNFFENFLQKPLFEFLASEYKK